MIVLVMGVAGAGKTTVGELLASQMGWQFADADQYHSPENVAKMASGVALTDEDRRGWLHTLRELISGWISRGENGVLACSALKTSYRRELLVDASVRVVYLRGDYNLIRERMLGRAGHYMNPNLLKSQFETLEEPTEEEAVIIDVAETPQKLVSLIRSALKL